MNTNKKIVAFDLETIADPAMLPLLPEVKAKATLKDLAKITADIEAKKKKQVFDMGLDPTLNLICCASWCDECGKPGSISIEEPTYDEEKKLILKFWDILSSYDHFVTYNGRNFDVRCLYLHGITHGIRPAVSIDRSKYNRTGSNHTDLRGILAGEGQFAKGKLDFFCKKFLGDQKTEGIDGAKVQSFFDMGLIDDIAEYCRQDALLTFRLFQRVEAAGLLE